MCVHSFRKWFKAFTFVANTQSWEQMLGHAIGGGTFNPFCVTGADLFVLQRKQEWAMRYKKKKRESVTQKLRKQQWFKLFALFHGKLSFVP